MIRFERYIIAEIIRPMTAALLLVIALFACFSAARYLAEATTESLGIGAMVKLVLLKTVIATEVLLPVALYFSVVIGLGRLHRDQEIVAMKAAGLGSSRQLTAVLMLALPIGVLVGALSMAGRPWAYQASYLIDAEAQAEFNPDRVQPGRFYGNEDSGRVFYVGRKQPGSNTMANVFLYRRHADLRSLIVADSARYRSVSDVVPRNRLELANGELHRFNRDPGVNERTDFKSLVLYIEEDEANVGYKRKAAATGVLMASELSADRAELQWRLSRPLATILLALLAIPLASVGPRQGKHERLVGAALFFAVYYNLSGLAQSWVEQGVVGALPGVWWLHVAMGLVVYFSLRPELRARQVGPS